MRNLLTVFLFIPIFSFGQEMALDEETDRVTFTEVVEVEGVNADELFSRGRQWFAESYKSANDVLQMDDAFNGKLIGKALSRIETKTHIGTNNNGKMWYTIQVFVKENRYKYTITDIEYQNEVSQQDLTPMRVPCENLLVGDGYYKKNGKPRDVSVSYSEATQAEVKSLVASLKKAMESKQLSSSTEEDW